MAWGLGGRKRQETSSHRTGTSPCQVTLMSPWTPDTENVKARAGGVIKRQGPPNPEELCARPRPKRLPRKDRPPLGLVPTGPARRPPARAPLTFQQPLDNTVDVEFIDIRHRRPAADPPAAAPPPARARVSLVLLPHATSPTSGGGGGGGSSSCGGSPPQPPRSRLPPPLATGTTRRTKWPPIPQASLGRRTNARAGVQRPGRDFFTGP